MHQIRYIRAYLRTSLWLIPGLIVTGAVVLAVTLIEVDVLRNSRPLGDHLPRLFGASAEGSCLLKILKILAGRTSDDQRHQALRQQADLIIEVAERSVPSVRDCAQIRVARSQVLPMPGTAGEQGRS